MPQIHATTDYYSNGCSVDPTKKPAPKGRTPFLKLINKR